MPDKLVDFTTKSLASFLKANVSGVSDCWVVGPDFDYDRKPSSADVRKTVKRELPFITVENVQDDTPPFSMNNILYEQNMQVIVAVYTANQSLLREYSGNMKQAIKGAAHPTTGEVGIQIFDYDVSGSTDAGAMQIDISSPTQYFGPADEHDSENRKHRSVTLVNLTGFKDKDAVLLENKGNINLDDNEL